MNKKFNIYLIGVGGQGIGLISEILLRAADHSGQVVKSVDTHGLAQRGGTVISQLRLGKRNHSPLIPKGLADIVVALEITEAMRGVVSMLKDSGVLIYYQTIWQPLPVRLNQAPAIEETDIHSYCKDRGMRVIPVFKPDLNDFRMQNMVVLAAINKLKIVPGINDSHYKQAMCDLMQGAMLKNNLKIFEEGI